MARFFVCGLTRDDFTDLTPKQMKHYEEMYHDPQLFFPAGQDPVCGTHYAGRLRAIYAGNKATPRAKNRSADMNTILFARSPPAGFFPLSEIIQQARRRTNERHF